LVPIQERNYQTGAFADIVTKPREVLRSAQDDDAQSYWTSGHGMPRLRIRAQLFCWGGLR
jgi:hypothetical protein